MSSLAEFRCRIAVFILAALAPVLHAQKAPSKNAYLHFALIKEGDPRHGRELFFGERAACSRCHSIDGSASKAAPDLFAIGDKFGRREIIESILFPSKTIAPGYSTLQVFTRDGETHEGILKNEDDTTLTLATANGERERIPVRAVQRRVFSETSLMPENLESGFSVTEFNDLIEFLVTLKQPASASLRDAGMPAEIPVIEHPVAVHPLRSAANHFQHPVWMAETPGHPGRFLVIENDAGRIWRFEPETDTKAMFLDLGTNLIRGGTRGLVGAALHPDFAQNRRYFLIISLALTNGTHSILFERRAAPDGLTDSGAPARELFRIKASSNNHYGGGLLFGPDGFLYAGMGDTGPQEDPRGHGQNMNELAGKMLRIDVDHLPDGQPYAIPADNPFVHTQGVRPEIWAYGLREPWRFSFDPVTHQLWAGDVGQDRYEEVDIIEKGRNYGWNVYEGFERFSNTYRRTNEVYTPPVFAYPRKYGPSVTGGYVFRGDPHSSFYGVYIFGDYESRRIFGLTARADGRLDEIRQIGTSPQRIVSFATDSQKRLYIVGYEGTIYQLDFSEARFAAPAGKTEAVQEPAKTFARLPLPAERFLIEGHAAFLIASPAPGRGKPWVWYAPALPAYPATEEQWMFERFLAAGISVAGIDVGESYGSPAGRKLYTVLYEEMIRRGYSAKPLLLGRSRGGLMTLTWAEENPEKTSGFAGIYPVCSIASYPGIAKAAPAFGMSAEELRAHLSEHNPIDRLAPLAKAGVPLFAIHGDKDTLVPLSENSAVVRDRYTELGGSMQLIVAPGQGHNMWTGFFQCQELVDFVKAHAR